MNDPTYNMQHIKDNPLWCEAFRLSEMYNNNAPIGWSDYIPAARAVANERREAARKLLAEVKRLEAIDETTRYYSSHAQALYNYVRKEYADIISKESI